MAPNPAFYRLEAEDLNLRYGFSVVDDAAAGASGDAYVSLPTGANGRAKTTFTGEAGEYQVIVHYFDENDGASVGTVKVGGVREKFRFNQDPGGDEPAADTRAQTVTHDTVRLEPGDKIYLNVRARGEEAGAVDFIGLRPVPPDQPEPGGGSTGFEATEAEVVRLVNQYRAQQGRDPLTVNDKLNLAAEGHSEDMATLDFFSHASPDGASAGDRIRDEGYDWRTYGENIGAGYDTPEQMVTAWSNSPGHRANMLNANFTEIGVGFVERSPDPGDYRYGEYWTMVAAAPADDFFA